MEQFIDLFLHFDEHLLEWVTAYGAWVYAILFLIVFAETGLVVTPFLPGDSLLFAAGAIAATGALDVRLTALLLIVAAIAGDAVNYSMGRMVGERVFRPSEQPAWWQRLLNRDHLDRAHEFFERYGGKAIVLARFVPIVRTFVPFVAGAASMSYPAFAFYNVTGAMLWVGLCVGVLLWLVIVVFLYV
jgi:membrane-associated protein